MTDASDAFPAGSHHLVRECIPPPAVWLSKSALLEEFAYLSGEVIRAPRFYGPCEYLSCSSNEVVVSPSTAATVDLCFSGDEATLEKFAAALPELLHAEVRLVDEGQPRQRSLLLKATLPAVPNEEVPSIEFIIESVEHVSLAELGSATSSLRPVTHDGGGMWSHTQNGAWVWTFPPGTTLTAALEHLRLWNKTLAETRFAHHNRRLVHFDHHSLFGNRRDIPLPQHALAATCRLCVPIESLHLHSVAFSVATSSDTTHLVTDAVLHWRTLGTEGDVARVAVLQYLLHWGVTNRDELPFTDACWLHIVLALAPVAFSSLKESVDAFFRTLVRFRWASRTIAVHPQTLLVYPRPRTPSTDTALVSVADIVTARSSPQNNLGTHRSARRPIVHTDLDTFNAAVCAVFAWEPVPSVGPAVTVPRSSGHVGFVLASEHLATSPLADLQRALARVNAGNRHYCSCSIFNPAAVDRATLIFALPRRESARPGEVDQDMLWQLRDYRGTIATFSRHQEHTYAVVDDRTLRNAGPIGMAVLFHDDAMTHEEQESRLCAVYRQVFDAEPPTVRWDSGLDPQKTWATVNLP